MKTKKLLVITAHPDDESFGPGGTIAKYAKEGVEVHVICATRGEAGERSSKFKVQSSKSENLHDVREQELLNASKILGVKQVDFLNFIDGTLNNQQYHAVAEKITQKFESFRPDVVMTFEPRGVSGHLDHVAMSFITTYAYQKSQIPKKLYYHCITYEESLDYQDYFVYFPLGYKDEDITTRIDTHSVWDLQAKAMKEHKTQWNDVQKILKFMEPKPKRDYFILFDSRVKTSKQETDLFEGIA